ncbi:Hint domain-containing protein [Kribbella sp. C-35]|uniref:Hint domain-containing protein n=1 Tax=Kribbella sp. C-35 TaxID=2789276 RepID=UPI00397B01C9
MAGKLLGSACSFSGDTLVEMGDGSRKDIADVKVGDEVLATDPQTGERGARKVTHLWVHSDTLLDLLVERGVLTTTEDHPFWNVTDREYQRADQLDPGDELLSPTGALVRVIGIRAGSQHVTTAYNLTVDGIHTYYVIAGATPVLVHNTCGSALGSGKAYSVAYETVLSSIMFPGRSRGAHFQAANRDLLAAIDSDSQFATLMNNLIPGVRDKPRRSTRRYLSAVTFGPLDLASCN